MTALWPLDTKTQKQQQLLLPPLTFTAHSHPTYTAGAVAILGSMSIPQRVRENTGFGLPPRPPEGPKFSTGGVPPSQTSLAEWDGRPHVTANYCLRPELRHMGLKQKELLFIYRLYDPKEARRPTWNITNLKHMNAILRDSGAETHSMVRSKKQVQTSVVQSQLNELLDIHEDGWDSHPAYQQAQEHPDVRFVTQYLRAADILSTWNLLGVLLGDMTIGQDLVPMQVFSATVKGWCQITDFWGSEAQPGSELYLILKRVWNDELGDYGFFQMVPYVLPAGMKTIPLHVREYQDFSGATKYGPYGYIGVVTDRYDGFTDERARKEEAGLISSNADEAGSAPKTWQALTTLEIYYGPPKGRKRRWEF